jgi:dTDP-glucose 4,6-dehydratase
MRRILITGGAGFIGSNFIPYFLEKHSDIYVVNLDLLTYAGNLDNLTEVEHHPRYTFVQGNITDRKLVQELFESHHFQGVIHFAAESHVDYSIEKPNIFIETNIKGTFTLLDIAYKHWMREPFHYKQSFHSSPPRFHHISTDEVYLSHIHN